MAEISILNGYKIKDKKAVRYYDTISNMKSDTTLKAGMYVKTKGYYSTNDGGSAEYIIRTKTNEDVEDNKTIYFINTSLVAEIVVKNEINLKQLGVTENTDITDYINTSLTKYGYANIPSGTYKCNISITSDNYYKIKGNNTILKPNNTSNPVIDILCAEISNQKIIEDIKLELTNSETGIKIAKPSTSQRDTYLSQRVILKGIYANLDSDFTGVVIDLEYLSEINISDIYIKRTGSESENTGTGIKISSCVNLNVYNSSIGYLNKAIDILTNNKSCEGISLNNVEMLFNNYGVYAESSNIYGILSLRVMNCMIDQVQKTGVLFNGVTSSSIINNWFGVNVSDSTAITLLSSVHENYGAIISDNTIWLNKSSNSYGIYIKRNNDYTIQNTNISKNTIYNYLQKAIFIDDTNSIGTLQLNNNYFGTSSNDATNTPLYYNAIPLRSSITNCINDGSTLKINDDILVKDCINIYNIKTFTASDITTGSTQRNTSNNNILLYITSQNNTSNDGYISIYLGDSQSNLSQKYIQNIRANSNNNVVYVVIPANYYYSILPSSAVTINTIYGKYV